MVPASSWIRGPKRCLAKDTLVLRLFQRPGVRLEHSRVTLAALEDLKSKSVDYLDAFHARLSLEKEYTVMSFDSDFKKWPELGWKRPK